MGGARASSPNVDGSYRRASPPGTRLLAAGRAARERGHRPLLRHSLTLVGFAVLAVTAPALADCTLSGNGIDGYPLLSF